MTYYYRLSKVTFYTREHFNSEVQAENKRVVDSSGADDAINAIVLRRRGPPPSLTVRRFSTRTRSFTTSGRRARAHEKTRETLTYLNLLKLR